MNPNYTLRYRKYENLLADVETDLRSISADGYIEPNQLIKIARKCNYELGLKIHQTKETVLEVESGRVKLPEDFYVMNFALLCGKWRFTHQLPQGTHIEMVSPEYKDWPKWLQDSSCSTEEITSKPACLTACGDQYHLVQKVNTETRHYEALYPIKFKRSSFIDCDCPNVHQTAADEAYIKDGFIWTNFDTGNLYINYEGNMVDEDGDLIVLDHPLVNEYYEYALKQRILENMIMDGNTQVGQQFELISMQYRAARNNAISFARMPNFNEMHQVKQANKKAMYSKYYDMFKPHFNPVRFRGNNAG